MPSTQGLVSLNKGTLQAAHFLPPHCCLPGQAFRHLLPGWGPPSSPSAWHSLHTCPLTALLPHGGQSDDPHSQIPPLSSSSSCSLPDTTSSQVLPWRLPCVQRLCLASKTQFRGSFLKNLFLICSPNKDAHSHTWKAQQETEQTQAESRTC